MPQSSARPSVCSLTVPSQGRVIPVKTAMPPTCVPYVASKRLRKRTGPGLSVASLVAPTLHLAAGW